jgi:hypothetical protein
MNTQVQNLAQQSVVASAKLTPLPNYNLPNLGKIEVLADLLRNSEVGGGAGDRVCFTKTGFVAGISIPGEPNSGQIYVYSIPNKQLYMVEVEGFSTGFSRANIDRLVPQVMNLLDKSDSRGHRHGHKKYHHHRRNGQRPGANVKTAEPVATSVAA